MEKQITTDELKHLKRVCRRATKAWDAHLQAADERRDLLRELRDRGFTLRELAAMSSMTYQRIGRIVAGHNTLYRKNLSARMASLESELAALRHEEPLR